MYDPIDIIDLCKYAYFEFNASKTFRTSCEKGQQKKEKGKGCETLRNHLLEHSTGEQVSWLQVIASWSGIKDITTWAQEHLKSFLFNRK